MTCVLDGVSSGDVVDASRLFRNAHVVKVVFGSFPDVERSRTRALNPHGSSGIRRFSNEKWTDNEHLEVHAEAAAQAKGPRKNQRIYYLEVRRIKERKYCVKEHHLPIFHQLTGGFGVGGKGIFCSAPPRPDAPQAWPSGLDILSQPAWERSLIQLASGAGCLSGDLRLPTPVQWEEPPHLPGDKQSLVCNLSVVSASIEPPVPACPGSKRNSNEKTPARDREAASSVPFPGPQPPNIRSSERFKLRASTVT